MECLQRQLISTAEEITFFLDSLEKPTSNRRSSVLFLDCQRARYLIRSRAFPDTLTLQLPSPWTPIKRSEAPLNRSLTSALCNIRTISILNPWPCNMQPGGIRGWYKFRKTRRTNDRAARAAGIMGTRERRLKIAGSPPTSVANYRRRSIVNDNRT